MAIAELARKAEIEASVVSVTPMLAAQYLALNTHNRNIRPTVVTRYARDMVAGYWNLNGETIKIAVNGLILDGQHRLQAVIESDCTVPMFVVTGLPPESQDTIDRGMPRNIADSLRLRGEVNVSLLASGISQSVLLQSSSPSDTNSWPSTKEALRYLDEHPDIRESVHWGDRLNKAISFPGSTAVALHHVFSLVESDDADAFFGLLETGVGLPVDSPILRLREMMIREISAQRRMGRNRLFALSTKAWNAWRRGDAMQQLRWATGGRQPEAFPRPE